MLKKAVTLLVIGFVVYYLLTAPEGAANAVKDAGGAVVEGFGQLMRFFEQLTQ